jgi:hypothetical protein
MRVQSHSGHLGKVEIRRELEEVGRELKIQLRVFR